ncbi:classical arabinogalactan protein 4-like [Miscanthus floridulus]|uniref:classical arabinogalactan protein 4-like n=1 Tax=Miscanthus floridulus TaxID=154761 RepID=UPI003457B197
MARQLKASRRILAAAVAAMFVASSLVGTVSAADAPAPAPTAAAPAFAAASVAAAVPALSRSRWELHRCPSPCPTPRSSDPALPEVPTAGAISAFPHRLFAPPPADAGHTGHCAARSPGVKQPSLQRSLEVQSTRLFPAPPAAAVHKTAPPPAAQSRHRCLSPRDTPPPGG